MQGSQAVVGMRAFVPYVSNLTMKDGIPHYFITEGTIAMIDSGRLVIRSDSGYYNSVLPDEACTSRAEAATVIIQRMRHIAASIVDAANTEESRVRAESEIINVGVSASPLVSEDER